jgi:hypothetical protein
MRTQRQDGIEKVLQRLTRIEEKCAQRATSGAPKNKAGIAPALPSAPSQGAVELVAIRT